MTKRCGYVALAGRPNAGKSTFLNQILGEKVSIVSDKPQTTRNRILGVYHEEDLQIGFLDLPGIHKPNHALNNLMMRAVQQGLNEVDLVIHFVDATERLGGGEKFVNKLLKERGIPVILALNKIDLVNKVKMIPKLQAIQESLEPENLVPISAKMGDNIDRLMALVREKMPEREFLFQDDELTDQPLRFMAQELIREKLLHFTHEEIPYATAVTLQVFEEREDPPSVFLSAVLWVESKNQRMIVLGREGQMISKIRQGARRSLKKLLGKPVELELFVKVQEDWRNRQDLLRDLQLS